MNAVSTCKGLITQISHQQALFVDLVDIPKSPLTNQVAIMHLITSKLSNKAVTAYLVM